MVGGGNRIYMTPRHETAGLCIRSETPNVIQTTDSGALLTFIPIFFVIPTFATKKCLRNVTEYRRSGLSWH